MIDDVAARLARAGFVASDLEAAELVSRSRGDGAVLEELVGRRLTGEPLAWIVGSVRFCGRTVAVDPGVYVPRWHTEIVARRALDRLPADGVAVDLCTGAGAIAKVLHDGRPGATVIGTDCSEAAVACARANGVDAVVGDLFGPVPADLVGRIDVVVGVVPYVPTDALALLQRDTLAFESTLSYDGGPDGLDLLRRAVAGAASHLRPGGALVLELGGDQADALANDLVAAGFVDVQRIEDEEGDVRGVEATLA